MFLSDIKDKTTVFIDANIFVYHFTANSRFNPSCTNFLNHPEIVKNLSLNQKIPSKIAMLNVEIVPLDIGIIERSQTIKTEYGFLSNDAVILQIMKEFNIGHLASNDSDFDRVDFITAYKPS